MTDLVVALGLVLVIEGLVWAAFPTYAMRLLEMAKATPPETLRTGGLVAVGVGVLIVWLVRG